jgi:hypothetical protein
VRLIKKISSPLLGLQVGQPSSFSLLPTSIRTRRIRSRKQEATVRLIKRISSPLLGLQVGQPSSFSLLPTLIKDREDQIQEAGGHCEAHQEELLLSLWPLDRTSPPH